MRENQHVTRQRGESTPKTDATSPKQLERLMEAVRAADLVKKLANTTPPRPAQTYGRLQDERSENQRMTSQP